MTADQNTDLTTKTDEAHDGVGLVDDNAKTIPAPGADEKKPDSPAPGADDQKPKADGTDPAAATAQETPEQEAERKLSRRQRAHQRERDRRVAAETEAKLLREQLAQAKSQGAEQKDVEPKREDFPDYEAYQDARQDWRASQREKASVQKAPNPGSEQRQEQRQPDPAHKAWVEREAEFQKGTKDYDSVVGPFVEEDMGSLAGGARQTILDSEAGPKLLYHLAKHPDVAERIADLPPARQVAELVKLEDELAKPAPKKQTGAPPPPNPVQGSRSAFAGLNENTTDAEYRALRKSQGARWAR